MQSNQRIKKNTEDFDNYSKLVLNLNKKILNEKDMELW
jgi:hypothetical protein